MNWRLLIAASGLAIGLLTTAPGFANPAFEPVSARQASLLVARADGSLVELQFDLVAPDGEEREVAEAALRHIAPSARVIGTPAGSVSAQWLPWTWKWNPDEIPVSVAYNPTGAPAGAGPGVVTPGLEAWSAVSSSSFRFRYGGITENTATVADFGPDGENVISWQALDCSRSCVLGVTTKDPVAHEVDMLLNSNPAAAEQLGVGTKVDWRTVVLHELGHVAGLEHSCPSPFGPCTAAEADAVMFFQYRGIMRALAPDDIAGISALYPAGSAPSPTPGAVPTASPSPVPEAPVFLEKGWNLLVLPELSVPALANGLPCLQAIYSYDDGDWLSWIRGAPAVIQELGAVGPDRAYWLLAANSCGKDFP